MDQKPKTLTTVRKLVYLKLQRAGLQFSRYKVDQVVSLTSCCFSNLTKFLDQCKNHRPCEATISQARFDSDFLKLLKASLNRSNRSDSRLKGSLHPSGLKLLFSTFLCAMKLAMCLAACLLEQPFINLLDIYNTNNYNGNNENNDGVFIQKCILLHFPIIIL